MNPDIYIDEGIRDREAYIAGFNLALGDPEPLYTREYC